MSRIAEVLLCLLVACLSVVERADVLRDYFASSSGKGAPCTHRATADTSADMKAQCIADRSIPVCPLPCLDYLYQPPGLRGAL